MSVLASEIHNEVNRDENSKSASGAGSNGRFAIGLDVGGTKIAGGLVCLDSGQVIASRTVPTSPERGGEAVLADALAIAKELVAAAGSGTGAVAGIGIGVAELVDPKGAIQSEHLIKWRGLPIVERFGGIGQAKIVSDVRAAALAEARFGAGKSRQLFAYISIGTGISSCLVLGGKPLTGARGNALVLSSAPISVPCGDGWTSFVLEDFSSGPAIAKRYKSATGAIAIQSEDVVVRAEKGDQMAVEIVESAGRALGSNVGFLINVTDPEAVVVGGGLGLAGGLFWESFVVSTRAHIWSEQTRELPIVMAGLGTSAGVIGAASYCDLAADQ